MMSVIGFDRIVEDLTSVTDFFAGKLKLIETDIADGAVSAVTIHFRDLKAAKVTANMNVAVQDFQIDGSVDNRGLMSSIAMWGLGLERCPPSMCYVWGAMEFGASLALMTDIRNQIIASVTVGSAAERDKKTSSFYTAY